MSLLAEAITLREREIRFGGVRYGFAVGHGPTSLSALTHRLAGLDADRFVIVADAGLTEDQIGEIARCAGETAATTVLSVPADEKTKSLGAVNSLAEQLIPTGVTRRSVVMALGGGLVGNMAGLLSALVFRGLRLVHVPTTLLAMSDSVLSLKQAVNSSVGKNHLGTFHAPVFVWNHLDFLRTLPADEIRSALCEMIKNVLGIVPDRYAEVAARLRADAEYTPEDIAFFIDLCVDAKSAVMCEDAHERGDALVLEYGHTIGHAAELLTGGELRHGYAIGLGMLAAARIARELGLLSAADEAAHRELLVRNGAPTVLPAGVDPEEVLRTVALDNKRGYVRGTAGSRDLILLEGLGKPHRPGGALITQVPEAVVRLGIESITSEVA
ncbi:2-deoxy-scyllo-inosose synthase [Streptomyces sp. NPDC048845]|uniref:2-deoxy-scyllo-inosose synthase n=1 Tax=Streptomyces sp. NPDC048845 TaxID=3155390 RepID=UPI0034130916